MYYTESIRKLFVVITILVIGSISIIKIGVIDMHTIFSTGMVLIPAVVVMGILGHKIGELFDNPKNKADAEYRQDIINALKKMDNSVTLQELNDKLTKNTANQEIAEPDETDELDI